MQRVDELPVATEIDFSELISVIWQKKLVILVTSTIFSVLAVCYALYLPNIYSSDALLAPVAEQKGGGLSSQLGGLAALAGVSLGGGAGVDKTDLAIEVVKSRDFLNRIIDKRIFLPDLMGEPRWHQKSNTLSYDQSLYDENSKTWVREVSEPKLPIPSSQEAYKALIELLKVSRDPDTGFVRVKIQHVSPFVARDWLLAIVDELNKEMKIRDIEEAEKSINYLQSQIQITNVADIKTALFTLIQEQTQKLMLANIRDEYAFKIIDSPLAPEEKSSPKRAFIVVLIAFMGGLLSILYVLASFSFSKKSKVKRNG